MQELFHLFYESTGLATDTRKIEQGSLFVALKGENFDGNDFVHQAIELGAKFVVCSKPELADGKHIFYVAATLLFIQKLALFHRRKFDIPVLAITGSNGKTTTKELVNAVVSRKFKTLATVGNLNNHLGVPFTLLGLNDTHELAIIEMGASKRGDIQELVEIAEPTHGLITGIGAAHIEGFGSLEGVIKTKSELYDFLFKAKGHVFVNGDDEILNLQLGTFPNKSTYGISASNEVIGAMKSMNPYLLFTWQIKGDQNVYTIETQMVGAYNMINYLCAVAVGCYFDVPKTDINAALNAYSPSNNRSQIVKTERNTVLMDAYNANVTSMHAALESFNDMEAAHKTVILGDMRELGSISAEEHQRVVDYLHTKLPEWQIFLVGEEFGKAALSSGMLHFFDSVTCKKHLEQVDLQNQLILLKGSRGIALEKLMDSL